MIVDEDELLENVITVELDVEHDEDEDE